MSDNSPQSGLTNPQVLTAMITGIVTVVVAVIGFLPTILSNSNNDAPAPTTTPIVIIATATFPPATDVPPATNTTVPPTDVVPTSVPPTNVPPTDIPVVPTTAVPIVPTTEPPTAIPVVPTTEPPTAVPVVAATATTVNGNTRLYYDSVSFTLLNLTEDRMDLRDVEFRSTSGEWEARGWGNNVINKLPADNCLRLRDATAGNRTPPAECANLFGLILVGSPAMFWVGVDSFDVYRGDTLLGTCSTAQETCLINIPQ